MLRFIDRRLLLGLTLTLVLHSTPAAAQDWFRTGTGLGVEKARVAVADFAPRSAAASPHAALFTQVVRDDLQFSGLIEIVSPSFYPVHIPSTPSELDGPSWAAAPASSQFLAFGNLTEPSGPASGASSTSSEVAIEAWFYDVRNAAAPAVVGKVYHGAATDAQVRKFAHQFADEIVTRLSGGLPGVSNTQIAFVSKRTGSKEIWLMDYDGANQHPITSLGTISLTPRWSPDASRIAFTCFQPAYGVVSPQICMYSIDLGKVVSFPRFHGSNSAPAWSPNGSQIMFSSSMLGGIPDLFTVDTSNGKPHRVTYSNGASTSPTWNPRTGATVALVSDRGGYPQLYLMNSDGTEITKVDLPDMGYVIDPAWSPNGQLLAFSWRRPNGNFDIYVMEVATRQLVELTRDEARNERPSWAPDGRHIVFESTRSGPRQIWVMLADGTQARQLTASGENESPNWSTR